MNIKRKYSPNKSNRNGSVPDVIVNHITEGSYEGSISWLCNPKSKVSAHFVVSKNGEITQLVDLKDMAWCNGTSSNKNSRTHCSKSKIEIIRRRNINANRYTISIENEGFFEDGQGGLTKKQYEASLYLHDYIIKEVKKLYGLDIGIDRKSIIGHSDVTPKSKPNCPGSKFPYEDLICDLRIMRNKCKIK